MDVFKKIKNYTYNERHCLGEGSFGRVYEGKSDDGLRVAIKKVQQRVISKDKYLRESLETQISIMKKLNHRNIVKLYDIVMTANSIYLVIEYCSGGDLKRYCRNRKLPEDQAYKIMQQICKGMQQIVKLGIIHRDLKPANILVHEGVFKICDFGFAKYFSDASRMAKTCVGTPIYMSPQVLNQKSYTNKADVWSLGILYYQLLFGKLPFYGSSQSELYRNILKEGLVLPATSKNTASLLKGMLQIQESKRFSWNNLFSHYKLGQVDDSIKQINPQLLKEKNQIQNLFYKQKQQITEEEHTKKHQNYVVPQDNNNKINNNKSNESLYRPQKSYLKDEDEQPRQNDRKPQRKPKNPLAFQNFQPSATVGHEQTHNNTSDIRPQKLQKPQQLQSGLESHPRFFYFVLIEMIVNPIDNCQNYPKFISTLYRETKQLYQSFTKQYKNNNLYSKILSRQYEELKSLSSEIPNSTGSSLKQDGQALIKQAHMKNVFLKNNSNVNNPKAQSIKWLEKLLMKDSQNHGR